MDSARSSSSQLPPPVRNSDQSVTRSTFCILRAWPRWFSPEPDPFPWVRFLRRETNEYGGRTLPPELSTASTPATAPRVRQDMKQCQRLLTKFPTRSFKAAWLDCYQ